MVCIHTAQVRKRLLHSTAFSKWQYIAIIKVNSYEQALVNKHFVYHNSQWLNDLMVNKKSRIILSDLSKETPKVQLRINWCHAKWNSAWMHLHHTDPPATAALVNFKNNKEAARFGCPSLCGDWLLFTIHKGLINKKDKKISEKTGLIVMQQNLAAEAQLWGGFCR